MSVSVLTRNGPGLPEASGTAVAPNESIQEVLTAIRLELSLDPAKTTKQVTKRMSDFVNLVNHLARALNTMPKDLTVAQVAEGEIIFLDYVARSGLSAGTRAQLPSNRNTLLRYARKFGFSPASFTLLDEWDTFTKRVSLNNGVSSIVKDAVRHGRHRVDFSELDLDTWADAALTAGRALTFVRSAKSNFLRTIRNAKLEHLFPQLDTGQKFPSFKLPFHLMPQPLQEEITDIVASRCKEAEHGGLPLAPATEQEIIAHFEEVVGYAVGLGGMVDLTSVRPLLNQTFIFEYAGFLREKRSCKRTTVVGRLSRLFSTLRCSPAFENYDLGWIDDVYSKLRKEPESALNARRRKRYVPFEDLALIPGKMRIERLNLAEPSPWTQAWRIHDELLVSCLILAQWPPRFLRLAEVGQNIFRGPIPTDGPPLDLPEWAKEQLSLDPEAEFWQFRYEDLQGELHRGLVLRQIVPLLELYLAEHRPLLLDPDNPNLLFWNKSGRALTPSSLGNLVSGVVWRYLKKRVTPTSIRSSFAYYWRDKKPNKDAVLAKIQWVDYPTIKMRYDEEYRKQRTARVHRRKHRYS